MDGKERASGPPAGIKKGDAEAAEEVAHIANPTDAEKVNTAMGPLSGTIDLARQQFPERLLALLEQKTCPTALYWLPGGEKFAVVPDNFAKQVLDPFFQGTKFESFTRKLNRW